MWIGQRRETGLTDQIRLRRAHRRDIHLVAAHDAHADADRSIALGRFEPESIGLMEQPLVRGRDGLLETDADARGLVVVVLVADRLGGESRRLQRVTRTRSRRHEEVEVALRPGDRTDARFDDDQCVGRIVEPVVLGDDP